MKKLHILILSVMFLFVGSKTQPTNLQQEKKIYISPKSLSDLGEYLSKKYRSRNEIIEYLTQRRIPYDLAKSVAKTYSEAYSKSIFDILTTSVLPATLTSILTTILLLNSLTIICQHSSPPN